MFRVFTEAYLTLIPMKSKCSLQRCFHHVEHQVSLQSFESIKDWAHMCAEADSVRNHPPGDRKAGLS